MSFIFTVMDDRKDVLFDAPQLLIKASTYFPSGRDNKSGLTGLD